MKNEQWQSGWIGDSAEIQASPQRRITALKNKYSRTNEQRSLRREVKRQFRAMVENEMPHLVGHDHTNFGQRALLQQVVVQRNPCRPQKTGDIRADPVGLARSVELVNVVHWNFIPACHLQNGIADGRIAQRLIFIR